MSCSEAQMPLKSRLDALDGPVELPKSFYALTLLMILTVTGIPLLYRKLWLFFFDLVVDIRSDLSSGEPPAGCKRIGKSGIRNLSKETFNAFHQTYARHPDFPLFEVPKGEVDSKLEEKDATGRIEALFLHPIKSTAPIEVQSAKITASGLENDRLFSFAQLTSSLPDLDGKVNHSWSFITQRSHARLALVRTELWVPDEDAEDYDEDGEWVKNGGCVVVRFPFSPDVTFSRNGVRAYAVIWLARWREKSFNADPMVHFKLPLRPVEQRIKEKGYTEENMKIWRENPNAWNLQSEVPEEMWARLKFHLGVSNPLTIFRVQTGSERELFKCAPGVDKVQYQPKIGFQDSYPIHIQNMSSINAVEADIRKTGLSYRSDSRRFRANIYVSGPKAFVEHDMMRMAIQCRVNSKSSGKSEVPEPIIFSLPSRTPRCTLPNVNPSNAEKNQSGEPLKSLKSTLIIDKGTDSPILGMHAVPLGNSIDRTICVGDEIMLYKSGEHLYNKDPSKDAWTEVW